MFVKLYTHETILHSRNIRRRAEKYGKADKSECARNWIELDWEEKKNKSAIKKKFSDLFSNLNC